MRALILIGFFGAEDESALQLFLVERVSRSRFSVQKVDSFYL
jgi:hypothetical protein